jgi:hypothetical protein
MKDETTFIKPDFLLVALAPNEINCNYRFEPTFLQSLDSWRCPVTVGFSNLIAIQAKANFRKAG